MKRISKEEYTKVSRCSDSILGRKFPYIPFDKVQDFLNKRGYDIIIHIGEYKNMELRESNPGTGEVRTVGHGDIMTEVAMAVKPGQPIPEDVSSDEAKEMYLWVVFERELIDKLLFE